jgi:hypothetical protein
MSTGSSIVTTVESFTSQAKTIAVEVLTLTYAKEGHGFTAAADIKTSMDRSLAFFRAHIK